MKGLSSVLVVLSLFLSGCSGGLSRKTAGEAIAASFQGHHIALLLKFGRVGAMCFDKAAGVLDEAPTTHIECIAASDAGLVSVTQDGADFWKIEPVGLEPPVLEMMKKNHRYGANGCDYQLAAVPIANRSLIEVTRINQITDVTAQTEFKWKWTLTPEGTKLAGQQPSSRLAELDWRLDNNILSQTDSRFTLTDIVQSTAPRDGKVTLNKTRQGWRVLEPPPKLQPVPSLEAWSWLTEAEIAKLTPEVRELWAAGRGHAWHRSESVNAMH